MCMLVHFFFFHLGSPKSFPLHQHACFWYECFVVICSFGFHQTWHCALWPNISTEVLWFDQMQLWTPELSCHVLFWNDFKLFGNGYITLPRLMAATIASLRSLQTSILFGIALTHLKVTRPGNWQNVCFYRGAHTCLWSVNQKYLIFPNFKACQGLDNFFLWCPDMENGIQYSVFSFSHDCINTALKKKCTLFVECADWKYECKKLKFTFVFAYFCL